MAKTIQDLWILNNDSGIVVFSRVFDQKLDTQLFGGFMSALNSFSEELAREGLTSFELSNKKFNILKVGELLFIASSDAKIKDKKVITELKLISQKFYDTYSDILKDWDNDIEVFSDFEAKIEDSLEDIIEKFKKAFWE